MYTVYSVVKCHELCAMFHLACAKFNTRCMNQFNHFFSSCNMDEIHIADIKVKKEEDAWCEMEAETTFHPSTTDIGEVGVKTEDGPTRWVVRGNVLKREFQQVLRMTRGVKVIALKFIFCFLSLAIIILL